MCIRDSIEAELHLLSEGRVPATVYLELFDLDGNTTGKYERTVPLGRRVKLSLEDVFGHSPVRGTLRVFSDAQVAVTLQRRTTNVVGDVIITDIPLQPTPANSVESLIFPRFTNGQGNATELLVINTGQEAKQGNLRIRSMEGEPRTMILR